MSAATHVFDRFGVRRLDTRRQRRLLRIGAGLYLASGVSVVQVWITAREVLAHPDLYLLSGLGVVIAAAITFGVSSWAGEAWLSRVFPAVVHGLLFGGAISIPVVLYFLGYGGADQGSGTPVYMLPLILGFYLLQRRLAMALVLVIACGHGALLLTATDIEARLALYVFLMVILISAGLLLGGLVDELDQSVRAEVQARQHLHEVNASLNDRVADQVADLERLGRLRRFLSSQVADAVLSAGSQEFLTPHRREIAVFFCDLRGFTAFAGQVEPEEVIAVLDGFYSTVGEQLDRFNATVGTFAGDGIMAYFNDPTPCEDPAVTAVEMALALRDSLDEVRAGWHRSGYQIGYGMGIATGHATLGVVGFQGRSDYTALGTVVNRAARLSDLAVDRQILIDVRTRLMVADRIRLVSLPDVTLKGFSKPVPCAEVEALIDSAPRQSSPGA